MYFDEIHMIQVLSISLTYNRVKVTPMENFDKIHIAQGPAILLDSRTTAKMNKWNSHGKMMGHFIKQQNICYNKSHTIWWNSHGTWAVHFTITFITSSKIQVTPLEDFDEIHMAQGPAIL